MARPRKLTDDEITTRLPQHPGWEYCDGALHRKFQFPDFVRAFAFMTEVALHAEKLDHHPDWSNVYNRVTMALSTHDAGGVTELDFTLAVHADEAFSRGS